MTFLTAKQYVARALGASANANRLSAAADAIAASIEEWNVRHDWRYLLMDTRNSFTVANCSTTNLSTTVTTTTTNGFAGVNLTVAVSGTGIPASTTVATINSVTSIELSSPATATGVVTLTFAGDIPVQTDVDLYNLPSQIKRPLDARLERNQRTLFWRDQNVYDHNIVNQNPRSTPIYWNTFNDASYSQTRQNGRVRLLPMPGATDTLRVRFFRPIIQPSADADLLDMPDRYTYSLLELARYYFLYNQDAENARTGEAKERAEFLFRKARYDDLEGSLERDVQMVPQIDHGVHRQIDSDDIIFGEF